LLCEEVESCALQSFAEAENRIVKRKNKM